MCGHSDHRVVVGVYREDPFATFPSEILAFESEADYGDWAEDNTGVVHQVVAAGGHDNTA